MGSKLRVALDARTLTTGIGTYTSELLKGLHARGVSVHAITKRDLAEQVAPLAEQVSFVEAPMYSMAEQWEIPRAGAQEQLLHVPHYNAPLFWRRKLVVTIHDLTHLLAPNFRNTWKAKLYAGPMLRTVAKRADHIMTVSQYSKERITELLDVRQEKVTVAYCGVKSVFTPGDRDEARRRVRDLRGVEREYVLYVGNLKPHKNLATLLRAMRQLQAAGVEAGL